MILKEVKGTKEEDKTPPAWFTLYMEKVGPSRWSTCQLLDEQRQHKSALLHSLSSRTRWCARPWRRSAVSSRDSAAFTSPWEGGQEVGEVEGRLLGERRPSRSPRSPPPPCPELHPPPPLPAPPAGGRPPEGATSAGTSCQQAGVSMCYSSMVLCQLSDPGHVEYPDVLCYKCIVGSPALRDGWMLTCRCWAICTVVLISIDKPMQTTALKWLGPFGHCWCGLDDF